MATALKILIYLLVFDLLLLVVWRWFWEHQEWLKAREDDYNVVPFKQKDPPPAA